MSGGVLAIPALLFGVLLAFAGGEALTRGARALLAGAVGLAGFAAVLISAAPEFAFAMRASALDLPGAVVGVAAGSLTANALIGALIASTSTEAPAAGARTFAGLSALAAAVLIGTAFDGVIGQVEGGVMLLIALIVAWVSVRKGCEAETFQFHPGRGLAWIAGGALLLAAGTWLALGAVAGLAQGRAEGDLLAGLTALGLGAALPEITATVIAARRGEGGQALVNICTGVALVLFGAVGAAALVRPVRVSDAFLGAPALAVAVSALVLVGVSLSRRRAPKATVAIGAVLYLGFLFAVFGSVG